MKKLALASVAVLGFASASHANMDTVNKSGFYVGLNGGYTFTKSKLKYDNEKKHKNLKGLIGGAHLGYQHDFGRMVGGLELSSDFTKVHKKLSESEVDGAETYTLKSKLTRQNVYGAAIRLGYKVAPCWVAGIKLGYERNNYQLKLTDIETVTATGTVTESISEKRKLKHNGFVPGVYIEKLLNRHWMVGAEYSYGIYKKKTFVDAEGNKISHKPQTHDFKVRLGYKF